MSPGAAPTPLAQARYHLGYQVAGRATLRVQRLRDERRLAARRPRPGDALLPTLASMARMKELMTGHYLRGRYVPGVRPVAWVTSGAPVEVLTALGFFLVYPENHAALCGARKQGAAYCVQAEDRGYSRDLCSYARTDIGAVLSGRTPVGSLPPPDLLVCCTNICQTVKWWYEVLADHFGCPLVTVDTPFLYGQAQPHQVDYVRRQIEEDLTPTAERASGRHLHPRRLREVVVQAHEASQLWLDILDRSQHRPAPMTAFDGFLLIGPIVNLRGHPETTRFYRHLLAELDARIAAGTGAVADERYRVLWDNLPVWYRLSGLSRQLAGLGVNVVASTYTYAWGELASMIDPDDPWGSVARTYLHPILNRSTGHKLDAMRGMVERFGLDGAILHSDRSCKPYSLGQIDQRDRLVGDLGVPTLLLEADHNDQRVWAEAQNTGRIEAFVEMMAAGR